MGPSGSGSLCAAVLQSITEKVKLLMVIRMTFRHFSYSQYLHPDYIPASESSLTLELGEESSPWGLWHHAGPRPWLWSTGVCLQGGGSICTSEAVMCAGVKLPCHWPPCSQELEPCSDLQGLSTWWAFTLPLRTQYGEEDWERTEVKGTLVDESRAASVTVSTAIADLWKASLLPLRDGARGVAQSGSQLSLCFWLRGEEWGCGADDLKVLCHSRLPLHTHAVRMLHCLEKPFSM